MQQQKSYNPVTHTCTDAATNVRLCNDARTGTHKAQAPSAEFLEIPQRAIGRKCHGWKIQVRYSHHSKKCNDSILNEVNLYFLVLLGSLLVSIKIITYLRNYYGSTNRFTTNRSTEISGWKTFRSQNSKPFRFHPFRSGNRTCHKRTSGRQHPAPPLGQH